jgi:ubiquinone/menaquinone biosynthesis C-methylase UbiE
VTRDQDRFVPALRFNRLTGLFDPVSRLTTREGTFKRRVLERAALVEGERVLDLACGTGTLALAAARSVPGLSVTGVDGDPAILERAREKAGREVTFDQGLSTELPYEDESFDVVLSTLFFHHLSDRAKLRSAEEVRRVLSPNGRLVIGDVGRPQDPLMRAAVLLTVQMLDGFDVTSGNVAGRLPVTLREAGLEDVRVTDRLRTPIGTLEIVTARP